MTKLRKHSPGLERCPFLPAAERPMRAAQLGAFGKDRGPSFYEAALECAQSLWLQGLPAQSLLLINRALGASLAGDEEVLARWPLPYAAAAWVMMHRRADQFVGNPRRHYQHLATRMVEPHRERREWRAWACWAMARRVFPDYPADDEQIAAEGIEEPGVATIRGRLGRFGIEGEVAVWEAALEMCGTVIPLDGGDG